MGRWRYPRNLPEWAAPQALPRDPLMASLAEISGWSLYAKCRCGHSAAVPLRLAAGKFPRASLRDYASRLACEKCGSQPTSMHLVDNPGRISSTPGGGPPANMAELVL